MKTTILKTVTGALFALLASCGSRTVESNGMTVKIDGDGNISALSYNGTIWNSPVVAETGIDGYGTTAVSASVKGDTIVYTRNLTNADNGRTAVLTGKFYPTTNSIRWESELLGDGTPCSAPIRTVFRTNTGRQSAFWTAWGRPQIDPDTVGDRRLRNALKLMNNPKNDWLNALVSIPFTNARYYYGAPYVTNETPEIAYCPADFGFLEKKYNGAVISVPLATVADPEKGNGITIAWAIDDYIQDLTLETSEDGTVAFTRFNHRIADTNPIRFSCDIVGHGDDWRESLAWVSARYPAYFKPENPFAKQMGGTGAYTTHDTDFDIQKMKDMAFSVNWRASFDFPYMGMFLPYTKDRTEEWTTIIKQKKSIAKMANYATEMKNAGFYVLNYFNVTEFGSYVNPEIPSKSTAEGEEWKVCEDYLYGKLGDALLTVPDGMNLSRCIYPKTKPGGHFYTWEDGVIMDCGVPSYADYLMDQTERHLEEIPDAYGFCIDRMDWLRMFNIKRDDGRSWYEGRPAASMILSWQGFMERFAKRVHDADKVIFVNNHTKRVDLLKHVDGFFDEFTNMENPLNTTAFTALYKPFLGWTPSVEDVKSDGGDDFFQKYLYMGAAPMCPFPGNDHSIRPDEWGDRQYLDYGPLIKAMNGREWVLEKHPVEVVSEDAKANIFKVGEDYIIPVVYAANAKATLRIGAIKGDRWQAETLYPGTKEFKPLGTIQGADPTLEVPMERGCVLLKISKLN